MIAPAVAAQVLTCVTTLWSHFKSHLKVELSVFAHLVLLR